MKAVHEKKITENEKLLRKIFACYYVLQKLCNGLFLALLYKNIAALVLTTNSLTIKDKEREKIGQ